VTVAFVLVLTGVGLFIRYIDHVADIIRAATIVTYIGTQSRRVLERRYPSDLAAGGVPTPVSPAVLTVPAPQPGVVSVNERVLVEPATDTDAVLVLIPRLGDFVPAGAPLLTIHPEPDRPAMDPGELETLGNRVIGEVALDTEQTMEHDLAFGFRQLVDIAERVLSPGINDPTTAVQTLDVLHDLLRRLATRHLPDGRSVGADGRLRLVVPQYGFGDFLDVAVGEIWRYGSDAAQVPGRIHALLADLASAALPEHRGAVDRWTALVGPCPVAAPSE
jgi:uncharacterized membrane protein